MRKLGKELHVGFVFDEVVQSDALAVNAPAVPVHDRDRWSTHPWMFQVLGASFLDKCTILFVCITLCASIKSRLYSVPTSGGKTPLLSTNYQEFKRPSTNHQEFKKAQNQTPKKSE